MPTTKPLLHAAKLRKQLLAHRDASRKLLEDKHPHAVAFFKSVGIKPEDIRGHATRLLTTGALASTLLLAPPPTSPSQILSATAVSPLYIEQTLSQQLGAVLPPTVQQLTTDQQEKITKIIKQTFGVPATFELDGNRLNRDYGLIGAEQHLPRFPGDSIEQHDQYLREGITPGLGAWGYFARSKSDLSPDLMEKEKYYVAVQTLYLPDFHERFTYYRDWYKYRKMLVVNPVNGKSIIAVVADAGPSWWTGKHFGGSPEVMAYLELNVHMQKGPVIMIFIDDPENAVPLGPLEYNKEKGKPTVQHT